MGKFSNPLDGIKIASPCSADWEAMYGNDRCRFCADCGLNVYNLSEMTKAEAEAFLINAEGRICVRLYRRSDGSVITRDCPVGFRAIKLKVVRVSGAVVSMAMSLFVGVGLAKFLKGTTIDFFNRQEPPREKQVFKISFGGGISNLSAIKAAILKDQ